MKNKKLVDLNKCEIKDRDVKYEYNDSVYILSYLVNIKAYQLGIFEKNHALGNIYYYYPKETKEKTKNVMTIMMDNWNSLNGQDKIIAFELLNEYKDILLVISSLRRN